MGGGAGVRRGERGGRTEDVGRTEEWGAARKEVKRAVEEKREVNRLKARGRRSKCSGWVAHVTIEHYNLLEFFLVRFSIKKFSFQFTIFFAYFSFY